MLKGKKLALKTEIEKGREQRCWSRKKEKYQNYFYSKVMRRVSSSGIGNLLLTNTKIMLISILSREVTKVFVTGI